MDYSVMTGALEEMEKTTKRLELTEILVRLLKATPPELLDKVVYLLQGKLRPDYEGVELGVADKLALRAVVTSSGLGAAKVEELYRQTGDIGAAGELALASKAQAVLFAEHVTVERVYSTLDRITRVSGEGAQETKLRYICSLLNDATARDAKYVLKIITGKLRLGIADYTVLDALAVAFTGSKENRTVLERAYNISSDLGSIARVLATEGINAVSSMKIEVFKPIRPMLAERVSTVGEALERTGGKCAAEYKLDGERLQIHRSGDKVMLFSRRLENITSHYPDAVEAVQEYVAAKEAILEAEAVAINQDTGELLPFQELMHRRRKHGIEEAMKEYPVALNFFDVLYHDGRDCTQLAYTERRELMEKVVKSDSAVKMVPALVTSDTKRIEQYMEEAISAGCEGLMLKHLESNYRAGAREFAWMKLKREYRSELADTLDLVIVGAFHGRGRRVGKYGALLLAAYDSDVDVFRTTSKVGTGFTDEDLANFYSLLNTQLIEHRSPRVDSKLEADVWFNPATVIEVIASEITLSPLYTCGTGAIREGSGLALRFPKFTGRIREEKAPEDATTVSEVISLYKKQLKVVREESSGQEKFAEL